MIPTAKLAALRALAHGISEAVKSVEDEVREFRRSTGGKSFTTPYGEISFRRNPPSIAYDRAALLAWASEHMAHEVVPEHQVTVPAEVRPTLYKTLEARLVISGSNVVDLDTGEVVDFAHVTDEKPDSVVFTQTREQKQQAAELVADRVDALTWQLEAS